jgi:glutamate--cysteine ligase
VSAQAPDRPTGAPVTNLLQLTAEFSQKGSTRETWRVGMEHEKLGLLADSLLPLPFDGPRGIEAILQRLSAQFNWSPVYEKERLVSLTRGAANITLEPGGQLELSGAPLATLKQSHEELKAHLDEVFSLSQEFGHLWLPLGLHPLATRAQISWMPKGRYSIMGQYMPKRGNRGVDMMLKTATVQGNFDYESEEDAVFKLKASTAISPLVTALFANSPFEEGKLTGWMSTRMAVWLDTDPDRSGVHSFLFEPELSFARYVEWALDVPMYLIYREGIPLNMTHITFRNFWRHGFEGHIALVDDWKLHLTTLFPEVRLKGGFVEVRGGDMGALDHQLALGALWKGILYDREACQEAFALVADLSFPERLALGESAAKRALAGSIKGAPLLPLARELVQIAKRGLTRINEETSYLQFVEEIAARGQSPAEQMVQRFDGNIEKLLRGIAMNS